MTKLVTIILDEVAIVKFNALKRKFKYRDYAEFLNKMLDIQYEKLK